MTIWLDAHVPPVLAQWLEQRFGVAGRAVRDIGLRDAKDTEIFFAAKSSDAIVMTKDDDFLILLDRYGPPPQVIWLTGGNTSTVRLQEVLALRFSDALSLLEAGEPRGDQLRTASSGGGRLTRRVGRVGAMTRV